MTQRPGPAARYSHLLNQEADENRKASIVQSPRQDSTLGNRGIVGFFVGPLSTLAVVGLTYLLLSHHLASNLCVTPYTQQIDFTPHPGFANLSFKYDSLWDQILSANGGFLADTIFGITMFHQLHCLQLLRIGLQQAHHENEGDAVTDSLGHDMHANPEHYLHCLDYLRQVQSLVRGFGSR